MTADVLGPLFYAAEITARFVAATFTSPVFGIGTHPIGALSMTSAPLSSSAIGYVSDVGYRAQVAGEYGVRCYPSRLDQPFSIDRHISLPPGEGVTAVAAGSLTLINFGNAFDDSVDELSTDGQPVRVLGGRKILPASDPRKIFLDPAYATLTPIFVGMGQPWQLDEDAVTLPLRDATYWLDGPVQPSVYAGTGGVRGTGDLAGKTLPFLRGGTLTNPVLNVPPTLVDPVALIYQVSDSPGAIVTVYEGGYAGSNGWQSAGQVGDIYAASVASGTYVYSSDSNGLLLRLGSKPARTVTVDAVGYMPDGSTTSTVLALALAIIRQQTAIDPTFLDLAAWSAADAAFPYAAGIFVPAGSNDTTLSTVSTLLGAVGAKLVTSRAGSMRPYVLRAPAISATTKAVFTTANTVTVTAQSLDASLDPPPYRWRTGYQRSYSVQTSDLSPLITDSSRISFLANQDRFAIWTGGGIFNAVAKPTDPDPVAGALLSASDAQAVANALGALFGVKRRAYAVVVPVEFGITVDIGDTVSITWPSGVLRATAIGQIVGEQLRGGDATTTLTVLV